MDIDEQVKLEVAQLERTAKAAGLSMKRACKLAGLPAATFFRWKKGSTSPRMDKFKQLEVAITQHRKSMTVKLREDRQASFPAEPLP